MNVQQAFSDTFHFSWVVHLRVVVLGHVTPTLTFQRTAELFHIPRPFTWRVWSCGDYGDFLDHLCYFCLRLQSLY